VAGRPNVGKSTLINAWLGEERLVAFDQPGTTRDAISVPFERDGRRFELIDTAGLRRKGKVFEAIEKFSVVKTLQAIADANVVLLLIDATQGVSDQDAHIAGYILEAAARWWWPSTSGTPPTTTSARCCSAPSKAAWPS
jgi:GTP-binding protein